MGNRDEGEISLREFKLEEMVECIDVLEILSKESIKSGKSDNIIKQIRESGRTIEDLTHNKQKIAKRLDSILLDEIGESSLLDIHEQTTEFIDDLISAIEQQRRAISSPDHPTEDSTSANIQANQIQDLTENRMVEHQFDESRSIQPDSNDDDSVGEPSVNENNPSIVDITNISRAMTEIQPEDAKKLAELGINDLKSLSELDPEKLVTENGFDAEDLKRWVNHASYLEKKSVTDLYGIGRQYAQHLTELGINTVGDLVQADVDELSEIPHCSRELAEDWIEQGREIHKEPFTDIPDLGAGTADKLKEAGIHDRVDLAAADPDKLAAIDYVTKQKAKKFISRA